MSSTLTNFLYHFVFSTKQRQPHISNELAKELYPYIGGIIREHKGKLLEIGGMEDHLHILAICHQATLIADMMRHIKGGSSKWVNAEKHLRFHFKWQNGYGGFSVSESLCEKVAHYIKNQAEHHKKMSFRQEYLALLKKHNISYDERYLWD